MDTTHYAIAFAERLLQKRRPVGSHAGDITIQSLQPNNCIIKNKVYGFSVSYKTNHKILPCIITSYSTLTGGI